MSWILGRDMSWLLPYATSFFKLDSAVLKYMPKKKDDRQWLGMMESLIALAYKRFRPGAKLKIKGFKITNDHSYPFQVMDNHFDLQGFKRSILGGTSGDMFNLKTPIYYSYHILRLIPEEEREILLKLALESVNYLLHDTYSNDVSALDCLTGLEQIIKQLQKNEFDLQFESPENSEDSENSDESKNSEAFTLLSKTQEKSLCIKTDYMEHPLTGKNFEIWKENLDLLVEICQEFEKAYYKYMNGGNYELHLERVRQANDRMRHQMEDYLDNLVKV